MPGSVPRKERLTAAKTATLQRRTNTSSTFTMADGKRRPPGPAANNNASHNSSHAKAAPTQKALESPSRRHPSQPTAKEAKSAKKVEAF